MSKLDWALALSKRGFRVFPLNDNLPAIVGFPQHATTDENTIRRWFVDDAYNIGIETTGMVVVDIDVKGGSNGLDSFNLLSGSFETFTVRTPTGGYHCYYHGQDSAPKVGILPGLDIRSHHSYVVAPGSVRRNGQYQIVYDLPLAPVPSLIAALLTLPNERKRELEIGIELDTPSAIANAAEWIKTAPPAVQGQAGDAQTYEVACQLVRNFALSEETAYDLIMRSYNSRCVPPWDDEELRNKIQNAANYGKNALGGSRPEAIFGNVVVVPKMPEPTPAGIYKGNTVSAMELKERPWIVTNLAMRGATTVLVAAGGYGKSLISLAFCAHFALGKDFGPYKLKVKGHCLASVIYNSEDDRDEQARRLMAVCLAYSLDYDAVRAQITLISRRDIKLTLAASVHGTPVADPAAKEILINVMQETKSDILILDPLINLHNCNENDNGHMKFVFDIINDVADTTKSAVFVMHHTAKGAGAKNERNSADNSRGASGIINSARIAIGLAGTSKEDAAQFDIVDADQFTYVRIDDQKTNLFKKSTEPIMWLYWQTIPLTTGDKIGVLMPAEMKKQAQENLDNIAALLYTAILEDGSGAISLSSAVAVLQSDNLYAKMKTVTLRERIQRTLRAPIEIGTDKIQFVRKRSDSGADELLVKLL